MEDGSIGLLLAGIPKTTPIGTSVMLMELGEVTKFFPNHTRLQLGGILKALGIPFLYDKDKTFFNLYTFEKTIYYLLRTGGYGFAAPGSTYRNKQRFKESRKKGLRTPVLQVTPKEIKEMNKAVIVSEQMTAGPRGQKNRKVHIQTLRTIETGMKTKKKTKGEVIS